MCSSVVVLQHNVLETKHKLEKVRESANVVYLSFDLLTANIVD